MFRNYNITLFSIFIFIRLGLCQYCDVCLGEQGIACVDKTSFRICSDESQVIPCPYGLVCDSSSPTFCVSSANNTASCGVCGKYDFACIGKSTFALCFDESNEPSDTVGNCTAGSYCDTLNPLFCSTPEITTTTNPGETTDPTTPIITTETPLPSTTIKTTTKKTTTKRTTTKRTTTTRRTTTKTPTISNPKEFCYHKKQLGRHNIPNDPSCRSYIYCTRDSSGEFTGVRLSCFWPFSYNCRTKLCGFRCNNSC